MGKISELWGGVLQNLSAINWFDSPATFRRDTMAKVLFIFLCAADMTLTVVARSMGFNELNPLMNFMMNTPALLLMVKLVIPVLIAWLMPGKLLLPSTALLGFAFVWNMKEMATFLVS